MIGGFDIYISVYPRTRQQGEQLRAMPNARQRDVIADTKQSRP